MGRRCLRRTYRIWINKMVLIGCDVEALYPSLEVENCSRIIAEEVLRTKIQFEDLD